MRTSTAAGSRRLSELAPIGFTAICPRLGWGYAGAVPGPTIEAERGHPVQVESRNELDSALPVVDDSEAGFSGAVCSWLERRDPRSGGSGP
jgi:FtsP/CotA-like multicopper oxidase with cupredoxin domain